ncbi:CinA family protein [Lignipirellula cremea]|uniref:Nicotinamide-nucleotide amidohydrolase PncC n=1 Tax=Lignipirellula cremea TaxID=2528010 RepID=A0A518E4R7_9BACT|nr:CinA family protein [Lignipirellula cremea]QDU99085.1 Nicotinamide-nucleotide amidohydrolase PncC [Lignipirellula cremea]
MTVRQQAKRVFDLLQAQNLKVVFAESCTGGLASGALTQFPGASQHHCGGMVVYRNATKQEYLGIPSAVLVDPGPVSALVAQRMCEAVLMETPEANLSASVTGHLGPDAPAELDGLVFLGVGRRTEDGLLSQVKELRLGAEFDRSQRQQQVIEALFHFLAEQLQETTD